MKTSLLRPQALMGLGSLAFALLFLCLPAQAMGQSAGSKGGKDDGDDDVGTLPATAAQDAPSLVLVGTLSELQDVIVDVQGTGKLSLRPAAPGSARLVLELEGSFDLTLDQAALASSKVQTLFSSGTTFAGGAAVFFLGGEWFGVYTLGTFTTQAVPLAAGEATLLRAFSLDGHAYELMSAPAGGLLRVSQALR